MKFIIIDMEIFERILSEIKDLSQILYNNHGGKGVHDWLDNKEVCDILHVSMRALQAYRDAGRLPFSKIGGVIYYKSEDIQKLLNKSKEKIVWK